MSDYAPVAAGTGARARVQFGGAFRAGMIMPNLGAIATIGVIVSPLALALHTATTAAPKSIAELGPQFLGALIIGPLAALLLKWIDSLIDGKLRGGFEMLVDNFTSGIVGGFSALVGVFALGPAVFWLTTAFATFVDGLINARLLPLASIIIEPAKILFLNNAIGNGVLVPLVAMMLFGPIAIRATVPAAIVVQSLGGIPEIYFPLCAHEADPAHRRNRRWSLRCAHVQPVQRRTACSRITGKHLRLHSGGLSG